METLSRIRIWLALALAAFLALFALQNMAAVEITVLFWTFESRRFVVIGLSFAIGLAIGWALHHRPAKKTPHVKSER